MRHSALSTVCQLKSECHRRHDEFFDTTQHLTLVFYDCGQTQAFRMANDHIVWPHPVQGRLQNSSASVKEDLR